MSRTTGCHLVAAGIMFIFAVGVSCDRSGRDAAPGDGTRSPDGEGDPATPLQTVLAVHKYRAEGRLAMIESHVVAEQRPYVLELLHAVDRLAAADQALGDAITRRLGRLTAEAFDYSQVANLVGVFSRDVDVLDEKIEGDAAVVMVQIAKRVPLDSVHLVRSGGRWLIRTDAPIPGLAAELGRLADVLSAAARRVADGRLTAEQLRRELDAQSAEVRRRIVEMTVTTKSPAP